MVDEQSIVVIPAGSAEVARVELATERERVPQLGRHRLWKRSQGCLPLGNGEPLWLGTGLCKELSNSSFFSRCPKKSKSCVRKEKSPTSLPRRSDAFNSWVELFTVIENETPDEDRLEALKAMFYSVNKINGTEGERVANYQLFQIAKKLTSGQFLCLRASYELFNGNDFRPGETANSRDWLGKIKEKTGSRRN
jgi:hypothetical protein